MPHANKDAPGKIAFPEELKLRLKSFITERSGLYFRDHDLKGLEDALAERIRSLGMDSAVKYYSYITDPEHREDELRELLNKLTITHTYFFRNEPQFRALKEKIMPEIIDRKLKENLVSDGERKKPSIRIWSAGCSTGEEPYSIAMILLDILPDIDLWDIQVIATDASTEAIDSARRGFYGKSSLKPVDREHIEKYFTVKEVEQGERYAIKSDVKRLVTFGFHNLMADDFPGGFDIIFFRNVSIYFDLETTIKILGRMYSCLNAAGYLLIGYSESLYFMQDKFRMVDWQEAIYYRKVSPGEARHVETPKPAPEGRTLDEVLEEISRAERAAQLETEAHKVKLPQKNIEEMLVRATKLYHTKDYEKALTVLREAITYEKEAVAPHYLQAQIYVNMGKFREAKQALASALAKDRMFAPAHYLLGCISLEESMYEAAKENLKKAIYIDKDFSLAHFYLANAYRSEGRPADAIREYRNAIKLLSAAESGDILAYGGGFDAAAFIGACRDNIERLKMES